MTDRPPVVLELPADPRFLLVARSVVAGVAAGLELPYDAVDDVRLAVNEAIGILLTVSGPGSRIVLQLRPDHDAFRARISTDTAETSHGPWPLEETRELDGLAWRIVTHLVDDAVAGTEDGHPSISLMRRTLASGTA